MDEECQQQVMDNVGAADFPGREAEAPRVRHTQGGAPLACAAILGFLTIYSFTCVYYSHDDWVRRASSFSQRKKLGGHVRAAEELALF